MVNSQKKYSRRIEKWNLGILPWLFAIERNCWSSILLMYEMVLKSLSTVVFWFAMSELKNDWNKNRTKNSARRFVRWCNRYITRMVILCCIYDYDCSYGAALFQCGYNLGSMVQGNFGFLVRWRTGLLGKQCVILRIRMAEDCTSSSHGFRKRNVWFCGLTVWWHWIYARRLCPSRVPWSMVNGFCWYCVGDGRTYNIPAHNHWLKFTMRCLSCYRQMQLTIDGTVDHIPRGLISIQGALF